MRNLQEATAILSIGSLASDLSQHALTTVQHLNMTHSVFQVLNLQHRQGKT